MNLERLEAQLTQLPLFAYFFTDPKDLEFSPRIRWICENECPRYGKSWACPPAVGSVEECAAKCKGYDSCLAIGTVTEVADIANMDECLATRFDHEALTEEVVGFLREQGAEPYILSTDSCALCAECAWCQGKPCRFPQKMHPCVESHGINLIPTLEENALPFQLGDNLVTWYSLLFY